MASVDPALITIVVGGFATVAIFSFLVKENPLYRFFEHLYIGIAAGFGVILTFKNFLWPRILSPMLGYSVVTYPDGTTSAPYNPGYLLYLIPMAFGLLYYFIYSKRYGWLAKIVIGFSLGMSGGIALKGFYNEMIPQIVGSFKPLVVAGTDGIDWWASFENTVFIVTLVAVMYYFFFSFRSEGRLSRGLSSTGRWLMMVCFGAFFGSTVMARMALLVERVQFLLNDWFGALKSLLV
jgi:hypothetical protein